jgi:hypothetical protein
MKSILFSFLLLLFFLPSQAQNNALHFDGNDDVVTLPPAQSPNFTTMEDFTIEVWVKLPMSQLDNSGAGNLILFEGQPNSDISHSIRVSNGTGPEDEGLIVFRRVSNPANIARLVSTTEVNDDEWHHIAVTKNGNTLTLYIDGVEEDNTPDVSMGMINDMDRLLFGARTQMPGLTNHLLGAIDEVRIWDVARTTLEIQQFMNREGFETDPNLIRYYNFNQGIPGGDNTAIVRVFNFEGPVQRHGFLNNFALNGETSNFIGSGVMLIPIPTLSQWGIFVLFLLFLIVGSVKIKSAHKKVFLRREGGLF